MIDWIKSLFGKGTIHFEFHCQDGSSGRAKLPYIGDIKTMDEDEMFRKLKSDLWLKYNKHMISAKVLAIE